MGPQSNVVDPSTNRTDRHVWLPADEEELENPRSRQVELDRIAFDIEKLFLRFETLIPSESNLSEATRGFIPEISSLYSGISDQISNEQKRRGALGQELVGVRSSR